MKIGITSFHFPNWQILVYAESLSHSGLALAAWGAFLRAAQDIKTNGTFNLLANGASGKNRGGNSRPNAPPKERCFRAARLYVALRRKGQLFD